MSTNRFRLLALCCAIFTLAAACSSGTETATTELPTLESTVHESDTSSSDERPASSDEDEGSDSNVESEGQGEASDEEIDPEIAMAEYEKCMSDQGIDIEISGSGDGGSSIQTFDDAPVGEEADTDTVVFDGTFDEDFEAAEEICGPILEDAFGSFEMTPEQEAELADDMLELERCLSDAGFEIDMDGGAFALGPEIDFEAFEAAMEECGTGVDTVESSQ